MPQIFKTTQRGKVAVQSASGAPARIKILDPQLKAGRYDPVIITQVGVSHSVNVQLMNTLRNLVYVYSFGDKMGQVQVSGVVFYDTCGGSSGPFAGVKHIMDYYNTNKASRIPVATVKIHLGSYNLTGFLLDVRINLSNAATQASQFTMNIATLPESLGNNSTATAASTAGEVNETGVPASASTIDALTSNILDEIESLPGANFSSAAGENVFTAYPPDTGLLADSPKVDPRTTTGTRLDTTGTSFA